MTCSNCGHNNKPEARFCAICGHPLAMEGEAAQVAPYVSPEGGADVLRPRKLGGLVDETFAVYRRLFWPFVLIALIPQVPSLITTIVPGLGSGVVALIFVLAGLFLSILASGAMVRAVAQQYVARRVDVGQCFSRAWYRVVSLVIASVLVTLALLGSMLLSIIIIGIPLFAYILVIWFFTTEAIMVEGRGPIAALKRSRELVRGSWWRVFGIGVVFALLLSGLSILGLIAAAIMAIVSPILGEFVLLAATALITPIFFIGRTLVYLDLRVRKEGYTLGGLVSETGR